MNQYINKYHSKKGRNIMTDCISHFQTKNLKLKKKNVCMVPETIVTRIHGKGRVYTYILLFFLHTLTQNGGC
jgi:hypothetical protein